MFNRRVGLPWALSSWLILYQLPVHAADSVVFGYSIDASPVSSAEIVKGKATKHILGFCGRLYDYLAQQGYDLRLQPLSFDERFESFANSLKGQAGIQCDPSSKNPDRQKKLVSVESSYKGAFSATFLLTSTKLLVRSHKLDLLESQPEAIKIGILRGRPGSAPVTTSLMEAVIPSAQFVALESRSEAVERLTLPDDDVLAIDAYASDEVMLADILYKDIPNKDISRKVSRMDYRIYPSGRGYSREEYGIVVYNHPNLLGKVNEWLQTDDGQQAIEDYLTVPSYGLIDTLVWLEQADHLQQVRWVLFGLLLLVIPGMIGIIWYWRPTVKPLVPLVQPEPSVLPMEQPQSLRLTERERPIASLKVKGLTAKQIAIELTRERGAEVTHRTVETHLQNIYRKLGTSDISKIEEYLRSNP